MEPNEQLEPGEILLDEEYKLLVENVIAAGGDEDMASIVVASFEIACLNMNFLELLKEGKIKIIGFDGTTPKFETITGNTPQALAEPPKPDEGEDWKLPTNRLGLS